MAVAVRSFTSTTYASRTNTTLTAPSGLADNDILLAAVFVGVSGTAPSVAAPSGFTALPGSPTSVTDVYGFNGKLNVFWKRAASESGSYTFSHSSASSQGLLLAISGAVTSGSPIDASSNNTGVGNTSTATGVTTTVPNDLLLYIAHDWEGVGALSPPSGFTEIFDSLIYSARMSQATAGASGSKTQTNGNLYDEPWAAWLVAVKPAAGGTAYTLTAALGTFALSGNATTLRAARQLVAATGAMTLTGVAANLRRGLKIPAAAGSFVLSGAAAGLKRTYALSAAVAAFTLSGKAADLSFGHRLVSAAGSFALSGQSVTLRYGRNLLSSQGSFTLSGNATNLSAARKLAAAAGSLALTGIAANLVYLPAGASYTLVAGTGSFGLSGQTAALRSGRRFVSTNGAFALTGQNAGLKAGRVLRSSQGSFALAGLAASLRAERKLASVKGSFVLTGFDAALTKSGGLSYTLVADTGLFVLSGQNATLTYLPLPGIRNPLERLKMYTGSMGSVSNREDWIVNISLVGDDGTSFDLTGAEIVAYVCREGCSNNPVLSASLGNGIVLTDNYTMQWHFDESQMASLCPQQYGVFCRVERDGITTQLLSANIAIVEGGPA